MEKVYYTRAQKTPPFEREFAVQNPIELDNKSLHLIDGDKKTLDYLDNSSTMIKGALAANGSIKLCPKRDYKYERDYGAYSPYERLKTIDLPSVDDENDEEFDNSWDNIFLRQSNDENFFETGMTANF